MNEKNIKLVIAEKPSVEQSIANVIGADKREDSLLSAMERKGIGTFATRAGSVVLCCGSRTDSLKLLAKR